MTNLAVILSARKDKTTEIPFPLLPYDDGLCLIDRTLSLVKEAGISRVILVVGYRADLFEKYRRENLQIVQATNYEFSASMASLAAARNFIDEDFILIEGDTFFEKKVLEQLKRINNGNCLVATEESGSGDECFIESKAGFITKISKDKHRICRFEGELLGISRISKETYAAMLDEWDTSANSYLNYEYVLMDVTTPLDRPFIFFKNLIWGDVDCLEDFKRLKEVTYRTLRRKEDPFDKDNLVKHLTDIFPGEDVSQAEIIQIGGMSNKNFRIDLLDKKFAEIPYAKIDEVCSKMNMVHAVFATPKDALTDPQAWENNYLRKIKLECGEELIVPCTPVQFDSMPEADFNLAPHLGANTKEVLMSLGYSAEEVDAMNASGAVKQHD